LRAICQKIISNLYLSVLAGSIVFVILIGVLNLPTRIAIGEKGQHAIKVLNAARLQFLEIKKEETLLVWTDDITRPTTSGLHKAIEAANTLFASFRQSVEYNPELLRQIVQLSEPYQNWIKIEKRLFELFQKMSADEHANGVNGQVLMEMSTASAMFLYVTRQLSEAENLIYVDIDRGRRAGHILIIFVGSLFFYFIGLLFLQQRFRKQELESQVEARTNDLNKANKNLQQEIQYHKQAEVALVASEEKFRMLVQQSITGTCVIQDGRFLYVNPYLAEMLDYKQEEMHGLRVLDLVAERDRNTVKENMRKRLSGEAPYLRYNFHALKKGGSEVSFEVYGSAMKYHGRPAIIATVLDISERKQREVEIKNTISLLNATLESTTDGILVVDREGKMTNFNKRFVSMWHLPESIVNSRDDNQALAFVLKQLKNPEVFLTKVKELYSQPYAESFDVLEFKDGRVFERFSRPQLIGEESVGRVWSFWDVTERRRAEEKIKHMAYHDPLTDLPNRSLFYDRLQQAIFCGKREDEPLSLMFLDLVDFKKVNDIYGHHCGDMLLKQLGLRLRGVLRESDTVARIGGDEFAIILPRPEKIEGAVRIAGKIIEAIRAPFTLNETTLNIAVSIGIVLYPEHGEDIDILTQRADSAMYEAKRSGKGFVVHGS